MSNVRTRFKVIIGVGTLVVAAVAGQYVAHISKPAARAEVSRGLDLGGAATCGSRPPEALGYIVRLSPGHTPAELPAGYQAYQAVAAGPTDTYLIFGPDGLPASALAPSSAVMSGGVLYSQSLNSTYMSCENRLEDNVADQGIASPAMAALVNGGLLTTSQLSASSTILTVADDPSHPGDEMVTVLVAVSDPSVASPPPTALPGGAIPPMPEAVSPTAPSGVNTPGVPLLFPVVADVNPVTNHVDFTGRGDWYIMQNTSSLDPEYETLCRTILPIVLCPFVLPRPQPSVGPIPTLNP